MRCWWYLRVALTLQRRLSAYWFTAPTSGWDGDRVRLCSVKRDRRRCICINIYSHPIYTVCPRLAGTENSEESEEETESWGLHQRHSQQLHMEHNRSIHDRCTQTYTHTHAGQRSGCGSGRYEECQCSVGYSVGEPKGHVTIQYKTILCVSQCWSTMIVSVC